MVDYNIDSSLNSNHNKCYHLKILYELLINTLNKSNIIQCNTNITRITSHQAPSCIDRIYSNMANNITTISNQ